MNKPRFYCSICGTPLMYRTPVGLRVNGRNACITCSTLHAAPDSKVHNPIVVFKVVLFVGLVVGALWFINTMWLTPLALTPIP